MTKEEISERHFDVPNADHEGICWVRADWDHIMDAMDEYAKQQAIAFDEWKRKNKWFSFENNGYWYQIFEVGTSRAHTLTSEQLYDQFIEQQNKP